MTFLSFKSNSFHLTASYLSLIFWFSSLFCFAFSLVIVKWYGGSYEGFQRKWCFCVCVYLNPCWGEQPGDILYEIYRFWILMLEIKSGPVCPHMKCLYFLGTGVGRAGHSRHWIWHTLRIPASWALGKVREREPSSTPLCTHQTTALTLSPLLPAHWTWFWCTTGGKGRKRRSHWETCVQVRIEEQEEGGFETRKVITVNFTLHSILGFSH